MTTILHAGPKSQGQGETAGGRQDWEALNPEFLSQSQKLSVHLKLESVLH